MQFSINRAGEYFLQLILLRDLDVPRLATARLNQSDVSVGREISLSLLFKIYL